MAFGLGKCKKCEAYNFYNMATCNECGARLPWADKVQAARHHKATAPAPVAASGAQIKEAGPNTPGALIGYALLSALIPFLGLAVGLVIVGKNPPRGYACLIGAALGFVIGLAFFSSR